jgi:hypothetical protein
MKIPFSCPACGAAGSVEAAFAGRQGRCKQCNHRFTIPEPGESEAEVYTLDGPAEVRAEAADVGPNPVSAFVPARGDEPSAFTSHRTRKRTEPTTIRPAHRRRHRRPESEFAWGTWLLRGAAVTVLALAAIALVAPRGTTIVGFVLLALGSLMVLVGFGAGAYGAFREDFLYGFLYMAIPLYTAYYLVTRWDDLWPWFACSTLGVGLVLLGTEMLRWSGAIP